MLPLTTERTKAIYRAAVDPTAGDREGADWWAEVQTELQQILAAPTIGDAARVIDWWHNDWTVFSDTPRAAAGRLRAAARKH